MKELYIIRHGKSSWELDFVDDLDRSLTDRGISDAHTIGKGLYDRKLVPEMIFSSPANRALHTAVIMSREMKVPGDRIIIKNDLYMPAEEDIEKTISEAPNDISKLAVFGHNPSFTIYANRFLKTPLDNLPTAGVVALTFDIESWNEISPGRIVNEYVDFPRKKH